MNWLAFSHGATLGASLIVAIGAQNAFVLRQGIMRAHVGKVVLLCALSDMLLIAAGVGGASALVERYPVSVRVVLYVGLAYLAWFGINALYRALRAHHAALDVGQSLVAWSEVLSALVYCCLRQGRLVHQIIMMLLQCPLFRWRHLRRTKNVPATRMMTSQIARRLRMTVSRSALNHRCLPAITVSDSGIA